MTPIEESLDHIKVTLDSAKKTLAALRIAIDTLLFIKQHGDTFSAHKANQAVDQILEAME